MKTLSLIVLVLSFAITTPAMAVDKDGTYEIQGNISCGVWAKDSGDAGWAFTVDHSWMAGYITAFNQQTPGVFSILNTIDMESVYLWMDKYCQENPLSNLVVGMEILTKELWPNRKRTQDD